MAKKRKRKSKSQKTEVSRNFDLAVGARNELTYGRIIKVWDCPWNSLDKWVLIENDDDRVKSSYSFYKYKDINGGELMTWHFMPPEILLELIGLDLDVSVNKTCRKSGG